MNSITFDFNLSALLRPNIRQLSAYRCARDEFKGEASVFLDANENSLGSFTAEEWNRYPDAYQQKVKEKLAELKGLSPANIFLGNGSDEPIDLLFRAFCEPGYDTAIITPPTYGMYEVQAAINNTPVVKALLNSDFSFPLQKVLSAIDTKTKLVFVCSPNNPTGKLVEKQDIATLLQAFKGIVVVDEAYIDFSPEGTVLPWIELFPNLVVLQTFSKAWGLAGLRAGVAYANSEIIAVLNRIKYPYNMNAFTQAQLLETLDKNQKMKQTVNELNREKQSLAAELRKIEMVKEVYASDANFLLVRVSEADKVYHLLQNKGIVVRNRSNQPLCHNCLRITIGKPEENIQLINALQEINKQLP